MSKSNTVSLSDRYSLDDLEPGVDKDEVAAFLQATPEEPSASPPKKQPPPKPPEPATKSKPKPAEKARAQSEPWTSRTIRLRQSTATALTKAALGQKSMQVDGKLSADVPVSVQEIAEQGIQLVLRELGYLR